MRPQEGQIVTVFRSHLRDEAREAYYEHNQRMAALADTMPGLVERKAFLAEDGERLTLVTFADRASHDAWRDHPEHLDAQRAGVRSYRRLRRAESEQRGTSVRSPEPIEAC